MLECEYDFQNYSMYVCLKSELLDPKIEKSPTYNDFETFDPHPQLDIKFSNLQHVRNFSILGSKSSFSEGVEGLKFENHTCTQALTLSLRGPVEIYTAKHAARVFKD